MAIKVNVNWPENMEQLENKAAEALAGILFKKLQPGEVDKLIEHLKYRTVDLKM